MIYRGLVGCEVDVEFHGIQHMLNIRKVQYVVNCLWSDEGSSVYSLRIEGISTMHECCGFVMFCTDPMEIILHIENCGDGPQVRRIYRRHGLVHVERVKLLLEEVERLEGGANQETVVRYNFFDPWRIDEVEYAGLLD